MEFLSDHEEKAPQGEKKGKERGVGRGGEQSCPKEGSGRAGFKEEEPSVSPVRPE